MMVKEELQEEKMVYECEECKLKYQDKEWAEKCEVWCKEHKSCHLDIIKHAIIKKEK